MVQDEYEEDPLNLDGSFQDIRGGEFGFGGDGRSSDIDNKKERERERYEKKRSEVKY